MADPLATVRKARAKRTDAEAALVAAIRAARDSGATLRAIAEAAELSHQRVYQIVGSSGQRSLG